MQSHLCMIDKSLKKLVEQVYVKITDPGTFEPDIIGQAWSAGKVHNNTGKSFIQGNIGMTVSFIPCLSPTARCAIAVVQGDPNILNRCGVRLSPDHFLR